MRFTLRLPKGVPRSTAARLISRSTDYLLSTTLITMWGDSLFFLFLAISSVVNVSLDYVLQKYWAFDQPPGKRRKFFYEAILFVFMRILFGAFGLVAVTLLYFYCEIPYAITGLIVAIPLWFAFYPINKLLFAHPSSSRSFPKWFRRLWIAARKKVRS